MFGSWDFETAEFDDTDFLTNAITVTVAKNDTSVNRSFQTLLMRMFGTQHGAAQASSPSTGALRTREIVVAQDVTPSFQQEIADARDADIAFLKTIYDNSLPGDQMGMVTIVGDSEVLTELTYVESDYRSILGDFSKLDWCDCNYYPSTAGGPTIAHSAPDMPRCNHGTDYYK